MKRRKAGVWMLMIAAIMLLAGCGKGDDNITIFMSDEGAVSQDAIGLVQEKLNTDLSELKVELNYSPLFNLQKVMIEYAAGGNSIVILPEDTIKTYGKDGAHIPLDEYFDKSEYPEGVFESGVLKDGENDAVLEEHLFGIPLTEMKMFQDTGYTPEGLLACVLVNAPDKEAAVKVLQKLTEG